MTTKNDGPPELSELGKWALWYVSALGWHVFPLYTCDEKGRCSCGDRSEDHLKRAGKHPQTRNGHLDATTDQEQIKAWWRRWPNANIGCACGRSGIAVLDVDGPEGAASIEAMVQEQGAIPLTPEASTPSGGRHIYFAAPVGVELGPKVRALPGLDVRAESSYIVLPPSRGWTGKLYAWTVQPEAAEGGGA